MPFVRAVYINNNFVTLTKEFNYDWHEIMVEAKNSLKAFLDSEKSVLADGYVQHLQTLSSAQEAAMFEGPDGEISARIKELIDTYVKPAVESDGGNIEFKSYKDGVVYVLMQGSCSGCPSSTVTLKTGIEGMLQRMVPEVKEVVQEMG
jgi:Fe-S cluster biogenesis protein NfuA